VNLKSLEGSIPNSRQILSYAALSYGLFIYLFIYLFIHGKKFIRYNKFQKMSKNPKIENPNPIITLIYNTKLPTHLISMNAVCLKILIEKAFKLI